MCFGISRATGNKQDPLAAGLDVMLELLYGHYPLLTSVDSSMALWTKEATLQQRRGGISP